MATVDLVNDIEPQNPTRPVRIGLSDLRNAITVADSGQTYSTSYLNTLNRNDLIQIARSLDIVLPFGYIQQSNPDDWQAETTYAVGDQVAVTGGVLQATTAGDSGTEEPTLPNDVGGTVSDGTADWVRIA